MKTMYCRRVNPEFNFQVKTLAKILSINETSVLELAIGTYYRTAIQILTTKPNDKRVMTPEKIGLR